jgi:hypothetical protein
MVHGSPILFALSSDYFTKEGLQGFGDLKIRQVIRTAKYTHGLVLLAKEKRVIRGMTDGLTETGRWYRMEMNVEKARAIDNLTAPQYGLRQVKDNWRMGNITTIMGSTSNYARCTSEIQSRIAMPKQHSTRIRIFSIANWT